MTIRFIKNYKQYSKGESQAVTKAEARRLIMLGVAIADKMLTKYKEK